MAHDTPTIEAQTRQHVGSKYAARLRRDGKLPAVIYGHQTDPAHIALEGERMTELVQDGTHLVEVKVDSRRETCLIKDVQYDYLGSSIIHLDLTRVDLSEEVTVEVAIDLTGQEQCPGLKEPHAFLEQPTTSLEVTCRADQIPDGIVVDISELNLGDSITVADLTLPEGVKTDLSEETVIGAIQVSRAEEAEEAELEAAAAAGEPEVIGEKEEEEGESEE
jgi:large subunit ribosomal protein L25